MRPVVLTLVIMSMGSFIATFVRATVVAPTEPTHAPAAKVAEAFATATSTEGQLPIHLIIPKIAVTAAVQYVGINGKGAMGVPNNYTDVAWYEYGTVPGKKGSAVMDGHVDNGFALPGVFKRLGELEVGDDMYVETKNHSELHFKVEETERYDYREVPTERIFERSDETRLNLVTCSGSWTRTGKTYDERFVVYARYIPE